MKCRFCGGPVGRQTRFCNACGKPVKRRRALPFVLGAVALLLVLALVGGMLTDWYGLNGPMVRIARGSIALVEAGSFTADYRLELEEKTYEGTLYCRLDLEDRDLAAHLVLGGDAAGTQVGLYRGYVLLSFSNGRAYKIDAREQLEELFGSAESSRDPEGFLQELILGLLEFAGMEDKMDPEGTARCLPKAAWNLNSTRWLKRYAGFTETADGSARTLRFTPRADVFLKALVRQFEPAFDREDDYRDTVDAIRENSEKIRRDYAMDISVTLDRGSLKKFTLDWEGEFCLTLAFSQVGSTRVDTQALEAIFEKTK